MKTLIDSSFDTRNWIYQILEAISRSLPSVTHSESTYWVCLESDIARLLACPPLLVQG
jgi:hypothetical protein